MADLFCKHDRIEGHCADCAYVAAIERGVAVPERPTPEKATKAVVVDVDTLVETGRGVDMLVAAGDAVPAHLADRPRRPRNPKSQRRRQRGS